MQCQIFLKTFKIIHSTTFSQYDRSLDGCSVGGGGGVSACRTGLEPVIPPSPALYRPARHNRLLVIA